MTSPATTSCAYCGTGQPGALTRHTGVVRCNDCGVLRPARGFSEAERGRLLAAQYERWLAGGAAFNPNFGRFDDEVRLLTSALGPGLAGGRALDVGTAMGEFVGQLGRLGMHPSGLELFAPSVEIARGQGLDVRHAPFEASALNAQFGAESFDLIAFRQSFYYLPLRDALDLARTRLRAGGHLFITSHVADNIAYSRPDVMLWGLGAWFTGFYDAATLRELVTGRGFEITHVREISSRPSDLVGAWGMSEPDAARLLGPEPVITPPASVWLVARPTPGS